MCVCKFHLAKSTLIWRFDRPILTYGGQGTAKSGVKPQDHAIVYTSDKGQKRRKEEKDIPPEELEGEEKLIKKPIRINPLTPRDNLHPASRLNYAKIYTVEYNVKVAFVGTLHEKSVKYFKRDFNNTHADLAPDPNTQYSDDELEIE